MQSKGKLFLVTAPSGAGKTTLVCDVVEKLADRYALHRVVTYTTKQPRPGEQQGRDYHFLTEDLFRQKLDEGFFVEHSTVYGAYYGFPREVFSQLPLGKSYMGIVDIEGAVAIMAYAPETITIGVRPPTHEVLEQRLLDRAREAEDEIAFRLDLAKNELGRIDEELFRYIIVNDDYSKAVERLTAIVYSELE
jgi:guanylate kinase